MQPIASNASRPTFTMSHPSANANRAVSGKPSLPEPTNTTLSFNPAIDGDEVHAAAGSRHLHGKLPPEPLIADGGLDSDGKAGRVGKLFHEVEHTVDIAECRMVRQADAVSSNRNSANRRDLRRHLRRGQHSAESRLRTLTELDLDRFDRRRRDRFEKPLHRELTQRIAAA